MNIREQKKRAIIVAVCAAVFVGLYALTWVCGVPQVRAHVMKYVAMNSDHSTSMSSLLEAHYPHAEFKSAFPILPFVSLSNHSSKLALFGDAVDGGFAFGMGRA